MKKILPLIELMKELEVIKNRINKLEEHAINE